MTLFKALAALGLCSSMCYAGSFLGKEMSPEERRQECLKWAIDVLRNKDILDILEFTQDQAIAFVRDELSYTYIPDNLKSKGDLGEKSNKSGSKQPLFSKDQRAEITREELLENLLESLTLLRKDLLSGVWKRKKTLKEEEKNIKEIWVLDTPYSMKDHGINFDEYYSEEHTRKFNLQDWKKAYGISENDEVTIWASSSFPHFKLYHKLWTLQTHLEGENPLPEGLIDELFLLSMTLEHTKFFIVCKLLGYEVPTHFIAPKKPLDVAYPFQLNPGSLGRLKTQTSFVIPDREEGGKAQLIEINLRNLSKEDLKRKFGQCVRCEAILAREGFLYYMDFYKAGGSFGIPKELESGKLLITSAEIRQKEDIEEIRTIGNKIFNLQEK